MAAPLNIKSLFDLQRCQTWWEIMPLILYSPFGLVLALLRFFIGFHAFMVACILPKLSSSRCFILRSLCSVLGIVVKQEGLENRNPSNRILVANHISLLDHLALDLVHPCILPGVWDLPKFLNWGLGYKDLGVKEGRDVLIQNAKKHIRECSTPILVHPEGATTNGKVGLLKFSTWPFVLDQQVQPIILTISRPTFANIAPSVLGSRWWSDLFWFLFVPYTVFSLKYSSPMYRKDSETAEAFSQRVQQWMAEQLGQAATSFTCSDKVEYAKKILRETGPPPRMPNNRNTRSSNSSTTPVSRGAELNIMSVRVKEVLPHVPLPIILEDLGKTRCVDATIARLLEGVVSYIPETFPSPSTVPSTRLRCTEGETSSSGSSHVKENSDKSFKMGSGPMVASAESFGRTVDERTRSYKERKALLLEDARQRYAQKHGLSQYTAG